MEGDPVDPATGSQVIRKQFLSLNGAITFGFSANYISDLLELGVMGRGGIMNTIQNYKLSMKIQSK
jgi:hypothetical protein